jgi:hypothetical protein
MNARMQTVCAGLRQNRVAERLHERRLPAMFGACMTLTPPTLNELQTGTVSRV